MMFDPETGEIQEPEEPCENCDRAIAERIQAEADLRHAEGELRKLRRRVSTLETELRRQREESPEGHKAKVLGRYWITRCGKSQRRTKLGDKRIKAVVARLRDGYDATYIARAIDGLAEFHFVNETTGQHYDDLELVCRDEVHLERFHDLAERMGAKTLIGPAWLDEMEPQPDESEEEVPF